MTSDVRTAADHRRLPRQKRPPRGRDQAIFVAYRTQGRTQAELAKDYRLSQSRVSAIIRRVEHWLADKRGGDVALAEPPLDHAQQLRLDRWLHRERSQAIYDRAIRAFDHGPSELTTCREGERDGKQFKDETRRQQGPNMQALRVAARTSADLGRLAEKSLPAQDEQNPAELRELVKRVLGELRHQACQAGRVARDPDPEALAGDFIKTFLGESNWGLWRAYLPRDEQTRAKNTQPPTVSEGPINSVPGPPCTPHDREAPASPPAGTLNFEPGTLNSPASNCSNPTTPDSPQADSPPGLPSEIPNLQSPIRNPQSAIQDSPDPFHETLRRRLERQKEIERFRDLQRRGLPCMIEWLPDEKPDPVYYRLDGYDYK
jgi:hypothetical protein